jgi:putative PIN family toxin of toxin-antitoxin system
MRLVLDANVIIAAFATRGLCESILEVSLHDHQILMCPHLLREITRNLRRKIRVPVDVADRIVTLLKENSIVVTPDTLPSNVCRDPDDIPVLGLAVAGGADYLVTGDKDLLSLGSSRSVRVVTPREFSSLLSNS